MSNIYRYLHQTVRDIYVKLTQIFFFCLGPVCLRSGFKHRSLLAYCATLNVIQHRFNIPVSLMKRQRSLIGAVLISFGLADSFPKML